MQPVQFQCGHCGKLMAVSSQHLGQQVRCPHCQLVVIAPSPPAATSQTPAPAAPPPGLAETILHAPNPAGASEDIFSAPNVADDLFSYSETPRLEIPSESMPPTLPGDSNVPVEQSQPTLASTLPLAAQQPTAEPPVPLVPLSQSESTAVLPGGVTPPWTGGALTETLPPPPVQAPLHDSQGELAATTRAARQTETKAPWFLLLVFCPLLLYSIVISIFAFFIYRNNQQLHELFRDRFDKMPDVGDDPGVRKGKKVSLTDRYKRELVTQKLPEYLCTTVGMPVRVGQLQVKPTRVERKRVAVIVESSRPEPCTNDSLVLYLDLKNLSDAYAFAPLDNYFDRYWRPGVDMIPPLTLLEVGDKYRFYGGPAHWYPRGDPHNRREWVKGRRDQADLLQPGEEKEMFVCTDGYDDKAAAALFGERTGEEHNSPFLWRVRVRRGLVRVGDKDYSATAVIGVHFTSSDIRQAESDIQ